MNRFLHRSKRHRIAAMVTHDYPAVEQAHVYQDLDSLGERLDAEIQVFYSTVPDPRGLPAQLKARLGGGIFVRRIPEIHAADADHFRTVVPDRFAGLMRSLQSLTGDSEEVLLERYDLQAAFSYARLMLAWGAEAIVSYYLQEMSLYAMVASHLLAIPNAFITVRIPDQHRYASLYPLLMSHASLIVPVSTDLLGQLLARFGEGLRDRIGLRDAEGTGYPSVEGQLRRLLASRAAGKPEARGPMAGLVTRRLPAPEPLAATKPFLVLGAERTGSSMLVDVLASQKRICCAGELFNPRGIAERQVPWLPEVECETGQLIPLRDADPGAFHLRLLHDGARAGAAWVGFKLLYFHGVMDNRVIDHLMSLPELKVIHLLRSDRLRRWLSHHKAALLDSWYTAQESTERRAIGPLRLDIVETITDFTYVALMEERYEALFENVGTIVMDYDELASSLQSTSKRLGDFFAMELSPLKPKSRKTGVRNLAKGIENIEELRAALQGTQWAHLIDG